MIQPLIEMAKDLTLALIENNLIAPEDMKKHLRQIHTSLCELKAREDLSLVSGEGRGAHSGTQPALKDWRKSIKKHSIECLICGATFKQLSARHLRQHDLDLARTANSSASRVSSRSLPKRPPPCADALYNKSARGKKPQPTSRHNNQHPRHDANERGKKPPPPTNHPDHILRLSICQQEAERDEESRDSAPHCGRD